MKLLLVFLEFYEILLASKAYISLKEANKNTSQFLSELDRRISVEFERYKDLELLECVRSLTRDKIKDLINEFRQDSYLGSIINDFEFLLFSFADEFFIYLKWKLNKKWLENPMELEEYGTKISGESIFRKIDSFLENHSKIEKEIGVIYLVTLSLGFCGIYRTHHDREEKINEYKNLLKKSFSSDYDIFEEINVLNKSSYSHIVERQIKKQINYDDLYKKAALFSLILILSSYLLAFVKSTKLYFEVINKL